MLEKNILDEQEKSTTAKEDWHKKAIHQLQDWVPFHISTMWQDTIPEYQIVTV